MAKRITSIWDDGRMVDLGTLGGTSSSAIDIDESGRVAGTADLAGDTTFHAVVWDRGVMTDLGTLGGILSRATGMNDAGQVIGNDTIRGGSGDDSLYGEAGRDSLDGGRGRDVCDGGAQSDRVRHCEPRNSIGSRAQARNQEGRHAQ